MTKAVELENLVGDFATELTDEEMAEIARYFGTTTVAAWIRSLRGA